VEVRRRLGRLFLPDRWLHWFFSAVPVAYADRDGDLRITLPRFHATVPWVRAFVDVTPAGSGAHVLVEFRPTDEARVIGLVVHVVAAVYGIAAIATDASPGNGFAVLAVLAVNQVRIRYSGWLLRRYVLPLVHEAVAGSR
jgi:hypothetical protein